MTPQEVREELRDVIVIALLWVVITVMVLVVANAVITHKYEKARMGTTTEVIHERDQTKLY